MQGEWVVLPSLTLAESAWITQWHDASKHAGSTCNASKHAGSNGIMPAREETSLDGGSSGSLSLSAEGPPRDDDAACNKKAQPALGGATKGRAIAKGRASGSHRIGRWLHSSPEYYVPEYVGPVTADAAGAAGGAEHSGGARALHA